MDGRPQRRRGPRTWSKRSGVGRRGDESREGTGLFFVGERQVHPEGGAAAFTLLDPRTSTVELGEPCHERQADADARVVRDDLVPLSERLEDRLTELDRYARACVFDPPAGPRLRRRSRGPRSACPEIVVRAGDPIRQIFNQTAEGNYDIAIIGARRRGQAGLYCYSERTYEVIKAVPASVLIATGEFEQIKRILVCTGGRHYIEDAVQLTGEIAKCIGASVTLLHVMAEPPAMYADLVRLEEDVERLLESDSELGLNLRGQKKSLEKMEVPVEVRIRHGIALDQIFAEVREGHHDMIVTGSSLARGPLRHYIMGDLTRSILNRAACPVLVARLGKAGTLAPGFWNSLKRIFIVL